MKYLPFGKEIIPTESEIQQQSNRFNLYDYCGIPYGQFDYPEEPNNNSMIKHDIKKARLLILSNKPIPKDLAERLLQYKHAKK